MSANSLANTASLVFLQDDLYQGFKSCTLFNAFNIWQYRKLRLQSIISADSLWATSRNGTKGAGLLIEMPSFEVEHPNITGPVKEMVISIVALEEPNVNFAKGGTQVSAEELAECALSFLHLWALNTFQTISAARNAIRPVTDTDFFQNLVAYRVSTNLSLPRTQFTKCVQPAISVNAGVVTLTNGSASPDAAIYYTTDYTFPAKIDGRAFAQSELNGFTSQLYVSPFSVASGTTVRWIAYQDNLLPSNVGYYFSP